LNLAVVDIQVGNYIL